MTLSDLPEGFGLVPLAQTNVAHAYRFRQPGRAERTFIARNVDAMALQATMVLRAALVDLRAGA